MAQQSSSSSLFVGGAYPLGESPYYYHDRDRFNRTSIVILGSIDIIIGSIDRHRYLNTLDRQ
jgi:hypothetical protein